MKALNHTIYFKASQKMTEINDESIDLVVTSPPYPMIEMWDEIMVKQNNEIKVAFDDVEPRKAFELMHQELDKVWKECWRVLKNGSFLCINIGDATRTINGEFALYNNNARIIQACEKIGFINLPNILWRKVSNAPNKFMGSGMLPCGAYVTLEHEWILIFRKGGKREFKTSAEKDYRRDSSFFWEERNVWFSDLWDVKGVKQSINQSPSRNRNASFPLEIPFRLINMYSQKGDVVLDPFMGLGTTAIAAIINERESVGYEIDNLLKPLLKDYFDTIDINQANGIIYNRYKKHLDFVTERLNQNKDVKYDNPNLDCKVMTNQETDLTFHYIEDVKMIDDTTQLVYESNYFQSRKLNNFPDTRKETLFYGT